jgi:dTDP-4-dehydrorhamnose reductase
MTTILVTGAKGQLGISIANIATNFPNFRLIFKSKSELNISNAKAVEELIKCDKIKVIINCAAYTNVDKAEDEPAVANKINHIAVEHLAKISKKHDVKLIHISTDYVFEGTSKIPYKETDITNPQNSYGATKLKGEQAMLRINPSNSILIRTSWVYAEHGANFVKTILRLTKEKETISVVKDQIGSPTYAADLARTILQLIPLLKNDGVEIYHYANTGTCSWFQFAEEIVNISKHNCKVVPIASSEFKTKVQRPPYSLLNTQKIQETFKVEIPHWKESLRTCIEKI